MRKLVLSLSLCCTPLFAEEAPDWIAGLVAKAKPSKEVREININIEKQGKDINIEKHIVRDPMMEPPVIPGEILVNFVSGTGVSENYSCRLGTDASCIFGGKVASSYADGSFTVRALPPHKGGLILHYSFKRDGYAAQGSFPLRPGGPVVLQSSPFGTLSATFVIEQPMFPPMRKTMRMLKPLAPLKPLKPLAPKPAWTPKSE